MQEIEFSWIYVFIIIGVAGYAFFKIKNDKKRK